MLLLLMLLLSFCCTFEISRFVGFVQAVEKAKEIIANLEGESFVVEVLEVESNSKVSGGVLLISSVHM